MTNTNFEQKFHKTLLNNKQKYFQVKSNYREIVFCGRLRRKNDTKINALPDDLQLLKSSIKSNFTRQQKKHKAENHRGKADI